MDSEIVQLLRTGNYVAKVKPSFSDWIIAATNAAVENTLSHSESYFLTLESMRPDIARALNETEFDPFCVAEISIVNFCAEVYKRW